jgi:trimeric autotransporter adhesin
MMIKSDIATSLRRAAPFALMMVATPAYADATADCNVPAGQPPISLECGVDASAPNIAATAVGGQSVASGQSSTALGQNSQATGDGGTAIGGDSVASALYSTAVGGGSNASGPGGASAFGVLANADGPSATAIGTFSTATAEAATALGGSAQATALGTTAAGSLANASANFATALGTASVASGVQSTALGNTASATGLNSVAIGYASVAGDADTVSVGAAGATRRITNVSPGMSATDAVNLSQLNAAGAGSLAAANAYTNTQITAVRFDLGKLRDQMRAGIAGSDAINGIPQNFAPGKSMIGVGVSQYGGSVGLALGISTTSANGRVSGRFSFSTATEGGPVHISGGAGFSF